MFINKIYSLRYFINNKTIGRCNYMFHNNKCYINNLLVEKSYRNKNIGSNILNDIETKCINNNINIIEINAKQNSLSSLNKFYLKNNYKLIKNQPEIFTNYGDDIIYIYKFHKNLS